MIKTIISMYITTLPVILAGICNMIVVKQKWFKDRAKPIDKESLWKDNKRIFGNNKTWLGFFTMIMCSTITHIIWGWICGLSIQLHELNQLYIFNKNTISYNIIVGSLMGFAYMICELPNSFIKRRLNIADGHTESGLKGKLFFIIDQIDSMIGIGVVVVIVSKISLLQYIGYIILGGITHITVNFILYKFKIRRNL